MKITVDTVNRISRELITAATSYGTFSDPGEEERAFYRLWEINGICKMAEAIIEFLDKEDVPDE